MTRVPARLRPWLALLFGLPWPSLGQFYSGRPQRACAALLLTLTVIIPAAVEVPMILSWSRPIALSGYLVGLGLLLLVPVDGALMATQPRPSSSSKWWACALYAVVVSLLMGMEMAWLPTHLPLRRFRIPSGAMMPTLLVGDVIIADMRLETIKSVELGDVVVFENPAESETLYAKRVAGLPGDRVEVRGGVLLLNDEARATVQTSEHGMGLIDETLGRHNYQITLASQNPYQDWGSARVPEGAIFVLSDNRHSNTDSRSFDFVAASEVRGRAIRIHWSREPHGKRIRWERIGMDLRSR